MTETKRSYNLGQILKLIQKNGTFFEIRAITENHRYVFRDKHTKPTYKIIIHIHTKAYFTFQCYQKT